MLLWDWKRQSLEFDGFYTEDVRRYERVNWNQFLFEKGNFVDYYWGLYSFQNFFDSNYKADWVRDFHKWDKNHQVFRLLGLILHEWFTCPFEQRKLWRLPGKMVWWKVFWFQFKMVWGYWNHNHFKFLLVKHLSNCWACSRNFVELCEHGDWSEDLLYQFDPKLHE